jgi:uncharacterized protein involved in exopolysaccharide biosynthesis
MNQQSTLQNEAPPQPCYEEDEINLLDLFLVLLKYKRGIIRAVVLAGLLAVLVSLQLPNIYRAEATIVPREDKSSPSISALSSLGGLGGLAGGILGLGGSGDLGKLEVALNSRMLAARLIKKHTLLPVIFEDDWNGAEQKWQTDEPPTVQDALEELKEMFSIAVDSKKGTLSVRFDHHDPAFAKKMVELYLDELSELMRENTLNDAAEKEAFLEEELSRTSDVLLKEKLYTLLAGEIERTTFAKAQKYYNFEVIDPPIVPDPDKKLKPKRALICVLAVVGAFFAAVFFSFFLEFLHNARETAEPEQLEKLNKLLPFKKKSR